MTLAPDSSGPLIEEKAMPDASPSFHWQQHLHTAARSIDDLVERGIIHPDRLPGLKAVADRFQMLVSDYYLSLIDPDDPSCPIRLQALPDESEARVGPYDRPDPIGDKVHGVTPIMVHRYPDRALLMPTLRCPMFCRYCFRKVAINDDAIRLHRDLGPSLEYLRTHPEIKEVILTGGDPLMLSERKLEELLGKIKGVPSVERLRIHSRFPVTLPMRITPELVLTLAAASPLTLVTHFNHPREITTEAKQGISLLRSAGISVFNQSVLLAGVNDDEAVQERLWRELARIEVHAHYLHHLDLAPGTAHLRVSMDRGIELSRNLMKRLGGLARPTYVIDIPGGGGKVPVDGHYVRPGNSVGTWWLESPLSGEVSLWIDPAVHPDGLNTH